MVHALHFLYPYRAKVICNIQNIEFWFDKKLLQFYISLKKKSLILEVVWDNLKIVPLDKNLQSP